MKKLDLIKIFYTTPGQRADKVECDDLKTPGERRGVVNVKREFRNILIKIVGQ